MVNRNRIQPEVYLISKPKVEWSEVYRYLKTVGGTSWADRIGEDGREKRDAENLVEFAGRACYRSWEPGLNPNVTKVREDSGDYLQNIIKVGHGSVLEHANFTFVFHNVSRVFTHELVRHRAGVAISQESLRFVRLDDIKVWLPEALTEIPEHGPNSEPDFTDRGGDPRNRAHDEFIEGFISMVETLEDWQEKAAEHFGLDEEGVPFSYKKHVTSALRRLAPIGLATTIVWTANVRTLRHVIEMRTAKGAEEEVRLVFDRVGQVIKTECPDLFSDYTIEDGEWTPGWRKV